MKVKKFLSLMLVFIIAFFSVPLNVGAAESEGDAVLLDSSFFEEYDSISGDTGYIENKEETEESEPETLEISESEVMNNLNITNGFYESEIEKITEDEASSGEDVQSIVVPEITLPEDGDPDSEICTVPDSGSIETNATPYITLSSSGGKVNVGATGKVTVGFGGVSGSVYLSASVNNSRLSVKWGSWSNNLTIPLYVTGVSSGSSQITVSLYSTYTDRLLASRKISVTVPEKVSLSVPFTSFDTVYNKTTALKVTIAGISQVQSISYTATDDVSCSWGNFSGNTIPLYIKGKNAGVADITIKVYNKNDKLLASKKVVVNVSKNASLTTSVSSLSTTVGSVSNITVSSENAYGSLRKQYSISNSNVACAWSGSVLKVTAKKAGSSTVTVSLYNGSGDLVAQKQIPVTVKNNVVLKPSVTSVSLKPGESRVISFAFSGISGGVTYSYSIADSSVCSAAWTGSWSNNSHPLTLTAKKAGKTTLTVYLKETSTDKVLTSANVTVNVSGDPEIKLSSSSLSLKSGEQSTLTATAENISGNYTLAYSTSGTCFSCEWSGDVSNNQSQLLIKATKTGSGTLTAYLMVSDKIVSKATCTVAVNQTQKPELSFSQSSMSIINGESAINYISCSGLTEAALIGYSLSNSNVSASWGSASNGKMPLIITGKKEGSTVVTIRLLRESDEEVLTSKSFTVTVKKDESGSIGINDLSYNFVNYTADIPLSTFQLAFGNNTKATRLYNNYHSTGGVCYGMSATATLFADKKNVTTSDFGKSTILSLSKSTDKSTKYNMTLKTFIEMMYVTQFSSVSAYAQNTSLQKLCDEVEKGHLVNIGIYGDAGHALVGYKLDKTNNRLYVSDSNYPGGTARYITLTKNSSGVYTGWSYTLWAGKTWGSTTGKNIEFQSIDSIISQWTQRGELEIYSYWISNLMMTNSDNFTVYDVEKNVVATYSDGKFDSELEGACYVPSFSYNPESDSEPEYNLFYLPTELYIIENNDKDIDSFKAEMIDEELGVAVETSADVITFSVDDEANLCSTNINLDTDDTYEVLMLSSRENEQDITVSGTGMTDDTVLSFSMTDGKLSHSESIGASICVNNNKQNYSTIEASAGKGGSISPEGKTDVINNSDAEYRITADKGYFIADVLVNGESVGAVEEYTFSRVDSDATIEAVFEKEHVSVEINDCPTSFNYGDKIRLTAAVQNLPEGAKLVWELDASSSASPEETASENELVIKCIGSGTVNVKAKLVDAQGQILDVENGAAFAEKSIDCKSNIILRILSFIKDLFRINRFVD